MLFIFCKAVSYFSLILLSLALGCLQYHLFSGINFATPEARPFWGLSLWHGLFLIKASSLWPWGLPAPSVVLAQPQGVSPCEHLAYLPRGPLSRALKRFLCTAPAFPAPSVCSTQCGRCVDTPHTHPCGAVRKVPAACTPGGHRPLPRVPSSQGSWSSTACLLASEGTSHVWSRSLLVLAGWFPTLLLHSGQSLAKAWHLQGSPRQGARARGLPSAPWISQQL